jgi:predicted metal-dependent phosphoesterase TrpH/glycosyltransferase involved in cell wall biosynthesis
VSADSPLAVAQVTPYAWEDAHAVNAHVRRAATALAARGHAVLVVAPSRDETLVHRSRRAVREGAVALTPGEVTLVAVGEALPVPGGSRGRAALPVDIARVVEELLGSLELDIVHVHEPFAPSVASAALRHSRSLNVGTFHAPTERLVMAQVARKLTRLVLGRLDARLTSSETTAALMARHFPAHYEVVTPGAEVPAAAAGRPAAPVRIVFVEQEERAALRTFLRGLRRLEDLEGWEAVVVSARGPSSTTPVSTELAARVRYVETDPDGDELAAAHVVVLASDGSQPAPELALAAVAAGAVPLASSLAAYEEALGDGQRGLLFAPRDSDTLAAQLRRLVTDAGLREQLVAGGAGLRARLAPGRVAERLEETYAGLVARRHPAAGDPAVWARIKDRPLIDVDLHMHTDHSHDCATPVEHLLATARDEGFGAIAITDHNEVSGALEAAGKAAEFGIKVIVAEEIKTASQGEVIGLFLQEKIPRGMTLRETVDAIKAQGGLVYVPHPFDRMHAVPDYEHLLTILDDVDAIETYNPRVAIGSFNEEAERFAAKYRIVRGAGSDSHVAAGLGSVRITMHDFDGPQEFLESLRHAEIRTKPGTLLYVQALKFLETKATPPAARRARRARRVRRASRNG